MDISWPLFIIKKVVSALCYPLGTALALWLIGIVAWIRKPGSRAGILLVLVGGLWLLFSSLPVTGLLLLRPLEVAAGPYADPTELKRQGVKHIVVLGGDVRTGDLSSSDRLAHTSLLRVMEAVRLWKGMPGGIIIVSGGTHVPKKMTTGAAMAILAQEMGVPREALVLETQSWDTDDEARILAPMLKERPFALVTSACHMKRSMLTFQRYGLNPLAAPTDFEVKFSSLNEYVPFIPGAAHLGRSEKAMHEYLGNSLLWIKQWLPATVR
jgi:uncharacterized SAM-binding protein YcdF (DUF218 family)